MPATQSNNPSDLLHPNATDLGGTHAEAGRTRELATAFSTPVFLGPIQAARKYMERQRSGVLSNEVVRDDGLGGSRRPSDLSGPVLGLHSREPASREHDRREQDRRLERSLYEGHSIEANLNYEVEGGERSFGSTFDDRAYITNAAGTERLFPYGEPYADSAAESDAVLNPEAVRGAILRLARESRVIPDSLADTSAIGNDYPAHLVHGPALIDDAILPAFADVARQIWAQEPAETEASPVLVEDGLAAAKNSIDAQEHIHVGAEEAHGAAGKTHLETQAGYGWERHGRSAPQSDVRSPLAAVNQQEPSASTVLPLPPLPLLPAFEEASTAREEVAKRETPVSPLSDSAEARIRDEEQGGRFEDAALAHDACNLLSAVSLYSELLNSPGVLDHPHRHYADELKLIAVRSQVLIDRLMRLRSSTDAGLSVAASGKLGADMSALNAEPDLQRSGLDTPNSDTLNSDTLNCDGLESDEREFHGRNPDTPQATLAYQYPHASPPVGGLSLDLPAPPNPGCLAMHCQGTEKPSGLHATPGAAPPLDPIGAATKPVLQESAELPANRIAPSPGSQRRSEQSQTGMAVPGRLLETGQQRVAPELSKVSGFEVQQDWAQKNALSADGTDVADRASGAPVSLPSETSASGPWPTSLVDLLMRWGSLLSTLAHGTLDVSFGPQAATPVAIAAESLERILVNLVKNARAATINGGSIRIGVGVCDEQPVLVAARPAVSEEGHVARAGAAGASHSSVVLTVDDSGCGMSEAEVRQILSIEAVGGNNISHAEGPGRSTASRTGTGLEQKSAKTPTDDQTDAVAAEDTYGASQGVKTSQPNICSGDAKAIAASISVVALAAATGAAARRSREGRGLGLRVVRGLVAQTGGTFAIHSRLGRGTRIEIRWPSANSVPVAVRPATAGPAAEVDQITAVPALPEIILASPLAATPPLAHESVLPVAIGPDGFSEDELRAMMLRLHRTGTSDQSYVQSLFDRRHAQPETSRGVGLATLERRFDPVANSVAAQRFGPARVTEDRLSTDTAIQPAIATPEITKPARTGAIAC